MTTNNKHKPKTGERVAMEKWIPEEESGLKKPKFQRAPTNSELKSLLEAPEKFDKLLAWQRQLIYELIETGNWNQAVENVGIASKIYETVSYQAINGEDIRTAFLQERLSPRVAAQVMSNVLHEKMIVPDKHGNYIKVPAPARLQFEVAKEIVRVFEEKKEPPKEKPKDIDLFPEIEGPKQ